MNEKKLHTELQVKSYMENRRRKNLDGTAGINIHVVDETNLNSVIKNIADFLIMSETLAKA